MKKEIIQTNDAPAAIGPYSQAVKVGNTLYASGSIPIDPATGEVVEGGISEQAEQVMKNIGGLLRAAGGDYPHVVKCSCFLADLEDFQAFNAVYGAYFVEEPPARSTFQVAKLPLGVKVEVEVIAVID